MSKQVKKAGPGAPKKADRKKIKRGFTVCVTDESIEKMGGHADARKKVVRYMETYKPPKTKVSKK